MPYHEKESFVHPKKIYSEIELIGLNTELAGLGPLKTSTRSFPSTDHYLVTRNAAKAEQYGNYHKIIVVNQALYDELSDKIFQWGRWKARREFGERKRLEDLQKTHENN